MSRDEARMTVSQIVMPHAQEARIESQAADLGLRGMHPPLPNLEGVGIMPAVEVARGGLESRPAHPLLPYPGRGQDAAREDVALDEVHGAAVTREGGIVDGDDLQGRAAARSQPVVHCPEERVPVAFAHRLEHLDGDHPVELTLYVAVIHELELHPVCE